MIWLLRNISIHLWITVLLSIPAVFVLLVFLRPVFPGSDPVLTAIIAFAVIFSGFGFLMDAAARKLVARLIKEGQAWERSGVVSKARKSYQRAIRIYDTFLFWPFSNRKAAGRICGAIARFNVNTGDGHPGFELASTVYLKMHPGDKDVAMPWLNRLGKKAAVSSLEQEVLTILARRYYNNPVVSATLADIFLRLERKDFEARRLYQYVANTSGNAAAGYQSRIKEIVGSPPDERLEKEAPYIAPPIKAPKTIRMGDIFQKANTLLTTTVKKGGEVFGAGLSFSVLQVNRIYMWVKESQKARFYLKTVFMSAVCIWLAFFMINTLAHMFKSRAVQKGDDKQLEIQVPKPFTLQVAAYLKQKHADRYVGILKKKGINASVKKAAGGGKTWYLVQVSEFVDKQSAAEYGRKLKQQKIIDDFFVNNK